ncbi:MAG: non-canonical purine NTP diphosphatase [Flavobacteriales bacterium]|nr:non-canonical purine NTP diphosphatase [Flavobacteriales bacterium]
MNAADHRLVFATANENKVMEVEKKLGGAIPLRGLKDIGCFEEVPETSPTIEGNAIQKARYVAEKYGVDCFADDTGLEVEALNNEPGVYSARYAGDQKNPSDNIDLLLKKLDGISNRKARFRTVICLIQGGKESIFEGIVEGEIIHERRGGEGFGYDPVFVPEHQPRTFAEMSLDEKNVISHRGRAIAKLREYLQPE